MHSMNSSGRATWLLGVSLWAVGMFPVQAALSTGASDEEVVVTGDPLQRADRHLVQPVSVVSRDKLLRRSVRNVGESVAQELGVTAGDFGGNVGRPVIRGLSGARVRVLDDGIGTMDVSTISPDHAVAVEPVFARQIEIFRGPATLLYGSGASGGLVNVVDERILDYVPGALAGEGYGHYDLATTGRTGAFQLEAGLADRFALHLDGLAADSEDYDIPDFAEVNPEVGELAGTLDNSASENANFSGGLSYVGSRGFLGLAVQRMDRNYGVPGIHHHHHEEGEEAEADEAGGVTVDQGQTRFDVKGELRDPLPGITAVRTRWGFNDHRHAEIEPSGELGTLLLNEEWEGRFEAVHRKVGMFDGVAGVQLQDRDFDARGEEAFVPRSSQRSVAGFIIEKADFGAVHVDLGMRFEHNRASDEAAGRETSFDVYSLSGGINHVYTPGYEIGLSITRAERAPSLEELFANGPHLATNTFEIGDRNLDSEVSNNFDVYWHKTAGRWQLNVGFFYNDIADFVFAREQDLNGDGVADRVEADFASTGVVVDEEDALLLLAQSQADAEFWGFELESRVVVFEDARGTLNWRLWSDYVEAALTGGERIPRIPSLRYGTGLEWRREAWSAEARLTRVTDQNRTAALESVTDGHTLLDLSLERSFNLSGDRELILFARGSNLLDAEIRRHTSFLKDVAPLPGASGLFGARLLF